jgi:hypothetical protein
MALKPIESVKFNAINQTVAALKMASLPMETILSAVAAQIEDFEATTTYRVKVENEVQADGTYITLIDTKKDFIRARKSGEAFQVLRAKVLGVPVDVKAAKDGEFSFSNIQIATALRELAVLVEALPKEVKDAGNDDFKSAPELEDEAPALVSAILPPDGTLDAGQFSTILSPVSQHAPVAIPSDHLLVESDDIVEREEEEEEELEEEEEEDFSRD